MVLGASRNSVEEDAQERDIQHGALQGILEVSRSKRKMIASALYVFEQWFGWNPKAPKGGRSYE